MSKFYRTFALATLAGASLSLQPAAAQTVGMTSAVRNSVKITTPANPVLHPAKVREKVALGNDIHTGRGSMAQLLLLDKTSVTVGANAKLRIDRFTFDPNRKASSVSISVAKGAFRFLSGKPVKGDPGKSKINTPVATIGIRGTILEGVVGAKAILIARREAPIPRDIAADEETASLIVLRGPGPQASGADAGAIEVTAGGTVSLVDRPGYAVFVPGEGQEPIGPFALSDEGARELRKLLGPLPEARGFSPWVPDPVTNKEFHVHYDYHSDL